MRSVLVAAVLALSSVQFALAATTRSSLCPSGKVNTLDPRCCPYHDLRGDMQQSLFSRGCNRNAQLMLRLSFHDAVGFSQSGKFQGGGADGSFITFADTELNYPANGGLGDAVNLLKPLLQRHPDVSPGDMIQFAAALAMTNCPGAPRLLFHAGRPNPTLAASDGTVPGPQQDTNAIFERMQDAGLSIEDTVNLMASHSVAHAPDIDPAAAGAPGLDSTSFQFDSQFYLETLLNGTGFPGHSSDPHNPAEVSSPLPDQRVMRLQSDFAIARDSRSACMWQGMINNQQLMMDKFLESMLKMSTIGQDTSKLFDCTEAIPAAKPPDFRRSAQFPSGRGIADVQKVCPAPFPL